MGWIQRVLLVTVMAVPALAQEGTDVIVLKNGDRLNGTIESLADGVVVFRSEHLQGPVEVPLSSILNLTTAGAVSLETTAGDRFERRIAGVQDNALLLDGAGSPVGPLLLDQLSRINPPPDAADWTGSVNIGGYMFTGNTERRGMNAAANAERRTDADRVSADVSWDYAEDKGDDPATANFNQWQLTQRRLGGGLKYDYFLSEVSYLWFNTRLLGDTQADIRLRVTAGTGYGYQWVEREDRSFLTEVGISYVNETYRRSPDPSEEYLAARIAYKLMMQLSDRIRLLQDVQAFPSIERKDDVLVNADTRLQMSLTDTMTAELKYQLDYDNTPSSGSAGGAPVERVDHRLFVTLGWTF